MCKVSIIITAFGKPYLLKKAILSVRNQTFTDIELIVVDDNSPNTEDRNSTEDIIFDFINSGYRIIYLRHETHLNGAVARNTGLKAASGEYIAFLDGDDEFYPDRIHKCYTKIEKLTEDFAGVYTGCEFRKSGMKYHSFKDVQPGRFLVETLACNFMFGSGSNIFVRKSVIDELNGFDECFLRHQDYEFLVRVFEKYSLAAIPEVLLVKNNENANLPMVESVIDIKDQYLKKFDKIIENLNDIEKRYIYNKNYLSIAEHALKSKKFMLSKKYYDLAKHYGDLSMNELFRRIVFTFFYLLKW